MRRTPAFWDASALVPCCVSEITTSQVRAYLHRYDPVIWWASIVEIHSALARLLRSGGLDAKAASGAHDRLARLRVGWSEIRPDEPVRDLACQLVTMYPLRAGDSLQLAAALIWCRQRPQGRTFICGDKRLGDAAEAAGFSVLQI
ncbi:type II toxin-antitoxin system VapC family toxin [Alloacidobacterium dinghuense]|uniref:Type II toxin-antitoxin system VapC family toxin n=1 Tax=Alloacidobacterium dinghuense TaxID=2763107 RepID=A0A7G8BJS2_9BACT|nr:type II toxin-antitoxin system VapC family toxin [Alloacidobacterium dinghuense]QNI32792.1 type II toxin-antitoxin system VapC family toxin [Alloacidobacterium dinghuense]